MPASLRKAILDPSSKAKVLDYMNSSLETRALIRTSTAVDVIKGGEKGTETSISDALYVHILIVMLINDLANALPETAYALINHRIAVEDSIQILKDHYIKILSPICKKWNFNLNAFGKEIGRKECGSGTLTLAGYDELEPSPVSIYSDARFSWLTGTLRGVFGKEVIVAPVLLTGR